MHPEKRKGRFRRYRLSTTIVQKFNKYLKPRKHLDRPKTTQNELEEICQDSPVLELNSSNYANVISDAKRDVVVEFYDQENRDCKIVHEVYTELGKGFKDSKDKITIARCNVRNVKVKYVYSLPTIKLFPANAKFLPVEYIPNDYACMEGYIRFIKEESYHQVQFQRPRPVESIE